VEEMDVADEELRQMLIRVWPEHAKKGITDLCVPPTTELQFERLTVGKIFAGLLIVENWRAKKEGKTISVG
jgi:voltage-dependent calcium channel N type alpha-1B